MTSTLQAGAATLLSAALSLVATGCGGRYRAPELPRNQLATLSVDSRATLLSVDGLPPPPSEVKRIGYGANSKDPPHKFAVGPGCRTLSAKYEESYFIWGQKQAVREGLGPGWGPALAKTEVHTYETFKPIQFFVPVRAGYTYWVTATFTGDEFLPRVVEIDASGEAVGRFLPDVQCGQR